MGSLDTTSGANIKTQIKLVDVTGATANTIETTFNNNWGSIGWRFVQAIVIGNKTFVIIEKQG